MTNASHSLSLKCCVVGDGSVGKTSLLMSYTTNSFPKDHVPTVFDNYHATIMVDQRLTQLSLWDTAGQEEYDRVRPLSYPDTDAFIVAFSLVDRESFANVEEKWIRELRHYCAVMPPVILVGTKMDLRHSKKTVVRSESESSSDVITRQEGVQCAGRIAAQQYVECSALTQAGVKQVFDAAIQAFLKRQRKKTTDGVQRKRKGICWVL